MPRDLKIHNYRIFKDLELKGLRRVNLIAGKNNTGKTALLEAIRMLEAKGDESVVNHILKQRGEFKIGWRENYAFILNYALRKSGDHKLNINDLTILKIDNEYNFQVKTAEKPQIPLNASIDQDPRDGAVYIPFMDGQNLTEAWWDTIALTELEDDVIKILQQTVASDLVRLDVRNRDVKVRLKSVGEPVSLKTLGDGVSRMLLIALALANAKDKVLLIDEFEAGIHHSVQQKLWELIFHYTKKWNIQAFITTHSQDTIRSFFYEGSKLENKEDTLFIRLQFDRTNELEAIQYNMDRLANALDLNIEIR